MLGFMRTMDENARVNAAIFVASGVVCSGSLWLVRRQATVGEVAYVRAMIPHHSIAILASERAAIEDPRVRELADEIIRTQCEEIAEMRAPVAEVARR